MDTLDLLMKRAAENSKAKGLNHGSIRPAWLIAVRERMLEFKLPNSSNTLALDVI